MKLNTLELIRTPGHLHDSRNAFQCQAITREHRDVLSSFQTTSVVASCPEKVLAVVGVMSIIRCGAEVFNSSFLSTKFPNFRVH